MAEPTERLGLARPEDGDTDWGDEYRSAMTTLDAAIADLQDLGAALVGEPDLYIQPAQPEGTGPYLWVQTGLPGGGWTIWFHDGTP